MANAKFNENDYLRKAQEGDEVSFLYLYDLWVDKVFTFCYLQTQDHETAEDVCLSVFRNAWAGLGDYRPESGPFYTWLFGIARVELVGRKANSRLNGNGASRTARPQLSPRRFDTSKYEPMISKLSELPAPHSEVLILKLVTGFSSDEICKTLRLKHDELLKIQAQGLMWIAGRPSPTIDADPRTSTRSKLNYLRSRIDVLQAHSYELDDDAFDTHVVQLAKLEAHWEDLTERSRRLDGAPERHWTELNMELDEVLGEVKQEAAI